MLCALLDMKRSLERKIRIRAANRRKQFRIVKGGKN